MADDSSMKYQAFVNDYQGGLDRTGLCKKYRVPEEKFDAFVDFLGKKGFDMTAPTRRSTVAHEIDYEIHGGRPAVRRGGIGSRRDRGR